MLRGWPLVLAIGLLAGCFSSDGPSGRTGARDGSPAIRVEPGSESDAAAYYEGLSKIFGFDVSKSTLQTVLDGMGYGGKLVAQRLETEPSEAIMADFPQDEVLVTRFFAPKITAVSTPAGSPQPPPAQFGWRKLVRIQARTDSWATRVGIDSMWLLFNVFQSWDHVREDPFASSPSNTNQVILVRSGKDVDGRWAYWLVYRGAQTGYALTDHLCASFDGDVAVTNGDCPMNARYHVPRACAQCHGGRRGPQLLNYLDSDHWNDRIQAGDDFVWLRQQSRHGVLFDGGRDTTSSEFLRAFDIVRRLNKKIQRQNCDLDDTSFQCRAVKTWVDGHEDSAEFRKPIQRPIRSGGVAWSGPDDAALLTDLNRFCFRCHSSYGYHVFDKAAVVTKRDDMIIKIERGRCRGGMPQDRDLDDATKERLVNRLSKLK
jgi:hypothetical protein